MKCDSKEYNDREGDYDDFEFVQVIQVLLNMMEWICTEVRLKLED